MFRESDLIYVYTRAQALEDGVLVDVSKMAKEAGFVCPVAITQALHARLTPGEEDKGQDYDGRLWDVLFVAAMTARRNRGDFAIILFEAKRRRVIDLRLDVHPGDQYEMVATIGFPDDF